MTLGITELTPVLKELYDGQTVEDLVYKNNPFFAMCPKMEGFEGKYLPIPLKVGNVASRSRTFSTAQTQSATASTILREFLLTRVSNYSVGQIGTEAMLASKSDKGAFVRGLKIEIDSALGAMARDLSVSMYRSGYGDIGQVGSFTGSTITLKNTDEITNFEVGMILEVSATQSGALRSGTVTIAGVNRGTGVITTSAAVTSGIAAIANDDFIFAQGDHTASTLTKLAGLDAWLPESVTSTAFFGVDRTADATRLAGVFYDGSAAATTTEALLAGAVRVAREGGTPDVCFVNFANFNRLVQELSSQVVYEGLSVGGIGFNSLVIQGPNSKINVVPDQNCPPKVAYLLQLDTWQLASIGKAVEVFKGDSLDLLRVYNSDALEIRVNFYGNLACSAPGWNGRIKLAN